jgi:hypothetical protein
MQGASISEDLDDEMKEVPQKLNIPVQKRNLLNRAPSMVGKTAACQSYY